MRIRAAAIFVCCVVFCLASAPAQAQYGVKTMSDPATGENYHVEVAGDFWFPTPDIVISSEGFGIVGSQIDFVQDLGIEKTRFKQLKLVLRPARKHKLRFEYTPITYEAVGALKANIIFNGIEYPVSLPVATDLQWKAYRFAYEYDFISRDRGFFGLILEAKYTNVQATLSNILDTEFASAKAPIPAIGVIGRVYVAPNISITGELSGLTTGSIGGDDYKAHYFDFDLYGTVNFNNHVGVQAGYRSFDVFYHIEEDDGDLNLKGLYFGGVLRF